MATYQLSQELQQWSLLHFEKGVPICDINVRKENKDRLARVSHVYWLWKKNPFLDTKELFRAMVKERGYQGTGAVCNAASLDQLLFEFVRDHLTPPSRKEAEQKVRVVADKLMQNGMATDNGKDMAEGAKILMKLDRLDQPESEQADMTKIMFLPPVVTTVVSDVDDTKEDVSDEQALAIINKYGAFVDPKRKMIDERVDVMMAQRGGEVQEAEYKEDNE